MIPTAEEFLQDSLEISHFYDDKTGRMVCFSDDVQKAMIGFTKLHVKECKKEISENVTIDDFGSPNGDGEWMPWNIINKESILNTYPLTLIK